MATRILNVKDSGVTRGVISRDAEIVADLVEVTFEDALGIPHTVFAHKNGPFQDAEAIIKAWEQHELHDRPSEQPAQESQPEQHHGFFS